MATCKNCIHEEVCKYTNEKISIGTTVGESIHDCKDYVSVPDVVEVVRCKDCKYFMPEHIKLDDGTKRAYTKEEKKLPLGVTGDVGINCGSRCMRYLYWEENSIPFWFQENDFCSYGERKES